MHLYTSRYINAGALPRQMPYAAMQHPGPYATFPWAAPAGLPPNGWLNYRVWSEDFESHVDIASIMPSRLVISMAPGVWGAMERNTAAEDQTCRTLTTWLAARWLSFHFLPKTEAEAREQWLVYCFCCDSVWPPPNETLRSRAFDALPASQRFMASHDIALVRKEVQPPFTLVTLRVSYGDRAAIGQREVVLRIRTPEPGPTAPAHWPRWPSQLSPSRVSSELSIAPLYSSIYSPPL